MLCSQRNGAAWLTARVSVVQKCPSPEFRHKLKKIETITRKKSKCMPVDKITSPKTHGVLEASCAALLRGNNKLKMRKKSFDLKKWGQSCRNSASRKTLHPEDELDHGSSGGFILYFNNLCRGREKFISILDYAEVQLYEILVINQLEEQGLIWDEPFKVFLHRTWACLMLTHESTVRLCVSKKL